MSLVMKGQSHFPGFALRLYYNTVYGHVKQSKRQITRLT